MKKLLFATAIAASAAALADPINAISFEGYNPGVAITFGDTEKDENGNDKAGATYGYFCFTGGESDSSVVTNDPAASTTKRTEWFKNDTNAKYLALDTEGGTLWRSVNPVEADTSGETPVYGLGTAQSVGDGIYLDTLVQFTVTEDEAPTVGEGDKLAIWLQAGEGVTNLMVKAAVVGGGARTATDFVLNANVDPGTWYRLTVKAVADITDGDNVAGFQVYLDGDLLTSETITVTSAYLADLEDFEDSHYADIAAGKYFASLLAANTLQGVGFQGTGAIDDLVLTEDDPFPAAVVEFTLTYSGDANVATLGAVTYTIGGGEAQTPTEGKIPDGATVSIAAPTFATGYQLAAFTVDGTPVASPTFPYTFTMSADTTVAITSAQITYTLTLPTVANATATVTAGGTTVSDLAAIPAGTEVVVTWTVTDPTYQITAGGTQNITMDSDVTATAPTVELITYTLTLPTVANATAAVTVAGQPASGATFTVGTEVLVTWTADSGYKITAGATQTIIMNSDVTATAPTVEEDVKEDWVDDVTTIVDGTKASVQYPSLAGTAVANADAKQLTTWAKGVGNVDFEDAGDDEINVDAFLLNIANDSTTAEIDAEKEAFVANITIAADGTPVVTTPTGKTYNGTLQLKGKVNLTDAAWTPVNAASTTYKFYMYELSLPAAE